MLSSSFFRSGARALVCTSVLLFACAATALFGQSTSPNDGYDPNVNGAILVATTQRDGKVIVGGVFTTVQPNGASDKIDRNNVARFNTDGSLDLNFNPNANDQINAIALQSDGKVLIGGLFSTLQPNNATAATPRNRLARLNADGSLDTAFNPNVTGSLAPQVTSIVVQADGKIVIGGTFRTVGTTVRNYLARLNADGSLDPTYNPSPNAAVLSLALQGDGKIIAGGSFTSLNPEGGASTVRSRLVRLNVNGYPDSEFDPKPNASVNAIAVQVDGKIVIGGTFSTVQPIGDSAVSTRSRLARFNADGTLDGAFNPNANGNVHSLLVQADGSLIVGGAFTVLRPNNDSAPSPRAYIARILVDGTLDPAFITNCNSPIYALAAQADTKILIGGYFTQLRSSGASIPITRNRLARLNADGSVDTTLDPSANGRVLTHAVQPDGKTLIGGYFTIVGGLTRNYIARLNLDGTVDTAFAPIANDLISAIAVQADGKILLGGAFTNISGTTRRYLARLNADGSVDSNYNPAPNAQVAALALQADGKLLIGGSFNTLQPNGTSATTTRNYLARLNTDGTVDAFDPGSNGTPNVITVLSDGKILLGGGFTYFTPNAGTNSTARAYSARLNSDGTVDTSWEPNLNGNVLSQVVQADGKIVIAGAFTALQPKTDAEFTTRYHIARLNADSSVDTAYNPRASAQINSIAIQSDGKIIAGGLFSFFRKGDVLANNVDINRIARLNTDGSVDTAFNPNAGGQVNCLTVLSTGKIIASGGFNALTPAGQGLVLAPNHVVRLTTAGLVDSTFDPALTAANGGQVTTLAVQPDAKLIVAGTFANFAGATSRNLARFNAAGSAETAFAPNPDGPVSAVIVQPARSTATTTTGNFGWFERDSSLRSTFDHYGVRQLTGTLRTILVQPDGKIVVAGAFTNETGLTNSNLARINRDGTFDSSYKPLINGEIFALALQSDGKLIFGGSFDNVNGVSRGRIGRLNADGSLDTSYDPQANTNVRALILQADGKLIVGGDFITLQPNSATATTSRNYIARLNTDGTVDAGYNPTANGAVYTFALQTDGKLLAGGAFTAFQPGATGTATTRDYLGRLNADGTVDTGFNPMPNGIVYAIALQPADGKPIIGGAFTAVRPNELGSYARNYIARLNTDGTLDSNFDPSANAPISAIAPYANGTILVGGDFTTFQPNNAAFRTSRTRLAILNSDGVLNPGFNPGPNGPVYAVVANSDGSALAAGSFSGLQADGSVLVGGAFATIGGSSLANLALVDGDGNASPSFTPNPNGLVAALVQQNDTKVIVGGNFTSIGGLPRNRLARLSITGVLESSYNPNVDGNVAALALQADGKLLLGGTFSTVAGVTRTNLARLNTDGALDTGFAPITNGAINALLVRPDGKLLIAGAFTTVNGGSRLRLARLNADGTLDPTFEASANGTIYTALVQSDGAPVLGGTFSTVAGQARYNLARLSSTSAAAQALVAASNRTSVTWQRSGSSPELTSARFEFSTDSANWTVLGFGTRVGATSNWQITGINLPATDTFYVRATGRANGLLRGLQTFNYSVTPAFNAIAAVGATTGTAFRLAMADGTVATYSADDLPPGMSLDPITGIITGTPTHAGTYTVTVTANNAGGSISTRLNIAVAAAGSTRANSPLLYNLSARATVTPTGLTTTGFVITGSSDKRVLIRAAGPTLAQFGIDDAVAKPHLRVIDANGKQILENAGWSSSVTLSALASRLGAFAYNAGSVDAAVSATLAPGGYTVQVSDDAAKGGTVLTEIYAADELTTTDTPRLINLSARALVQTGKTLVAGFIVTGQPGTVQKVLVRAIGPTLAKFGVTNALAAPVLKVYDSTGARIAFNDAWANNTEVSAAAAATGAFALEAGTKDAALVLSLSPGAYTLEISTTGAAGEALADIYAVPQ